MSTIGSAQRPVRRSPGWIRRLGAQCWIHRRTAAGALAVTMIAAVIDISFPLLTRIAIDDASAGEGSTIGAIAIAIGGLGVIRFGCQFGRRFLAGRLSIDVQHDLRLGLLASLQRLDGRRQDDIRTGQVVSRTITDLQLVQGLLAMMPLSAGALLQFVLALVVMAYLSPLLTVVALLIVPAVSIVVYRIRPTLYAATWSAQQRAGDLAQHVEETVTGVRVVKGFGQEARAVDRLENLSRTLFAERMRSARINSRFTPSMAAIPQLGLVGVIALGGYLAMTDHITIGTFLAFATYVATLSAVTRTLSSVIIMAQLSRAAVERVYEVIDTEPSVPEPENPTHLPDGPLGVDLSAVTFGFEEERDVLRSFDLTVAPGESVAIVGHAGSGKTALSLLLPRFYSPRIGSVALTSHGRRFDVADISAEQLRGAVGLVFDEPFLFSDTIAANIALGRPDATAEDITRAATLAEASSFIDALPDGYDSVVGERGLTLSGGQRQRIALARALLTDPRILVLDDATSAVDATTEAAIFDALRAGRERTTLILAHRRSTLTLADRVAVLDDGRIIDFGTVAELDERCPLFRLLLADGEGPRDIPTIERSAEPTESMLWPELEKSVDSVSHRTPTAPAGRGRPTSGSLGQVASTPQLQAAVDALPQATEDPHASDAEIRAADPQFRLSRLLKPVRLLLATVVVLLALDSLSAIAFPSIVRFAVDDGVSRGNAGALWAATALGVVLAAVGWFVIAATTMITARAGERVLFGLRVKSYAHIQRLGLDYYERELSGRIMTRMTTDVDALSSFIQTGASTAVVSLLTVIGIAAALLVTDLTLGLVALAVVPPLILATIIFRKVSAVAYSQSRERISTVNADFQENVAGLRSAQAYRREEFAALQFAERADRYRRSRMRSQRAISVFFPFITLLSDVALAFVVFVGAHQVATGSTSAGTFVAFVLYLGLLFGPIQQLSQVFDGYQQASVGVSRIGDLLRTPSSIEAGSDTDTVPIEGGQLRSDVHLDNVSFRYAGAETDALTEVNLTIPLGTTVALVGQTGAGKSTVIKLLARFYDPTSGSVRVGGTDLRRYRLSEYRRRLGVVPQEAHLFTGDVASNIAFGRPDASRADIESAARAVGALDIIAGLRGGMYQPVGERGQGLSAGQRQLIALARAELVDPDLLLLDEATATLDPATERIVLTASDAVLRKRTSVVVAHRLATAARADMIVVVDSGRIVEVGTHDRLRTHGGFYTQLWNAAETRGGNTPIDRAVISNEADSYS
ncbi:ABC transporter ATP-binding protein [Rhodococcus sp. PAMC28707]|uniref:ABC transporter ATP-binding protein n=1 Tax=unclassified Rhodococcus (in: high G+C Gram-positive bacteria) TaxID=192944 RepID=UPI00109DA760|nr:MULTISPECIES: ABC transporter ATP-binding protein [unclassified Rhodococcus (in: high G+C Gram-positive bacteria)]QCB52189.1 ABC transporter ATP-binding protein [Rhodococcus sp. PAMC28705]QCB59640.1 ABC transporter ATP-binding protein [Rhodococcus sp. PAMC28707]